LREKEAPVPLVDDYHLNRRPARSMTDNHEDHAGEADSAGRSGEAAQRGGRRYPRVSSTAREHVTAAARGDTTSALLRRAQFLRREERQLLELAVQSDLSVRQIARLNNVPPGTISRRVQRLCARLRDPLVNWLIDPATCKLPPEHRQLAIEYFIQGYSANELADKHLLRASRVRQMLDQVRGWYRAMTSG
jgi:DNA-directed RNA polymerase specialized sigma24 family protein